MSQTAHTFTIVLERCSDGWDARATALPSVRVRAPYRGLANKLIAKAVRDYVRSLLAEGRDIPADEPAPVGCEKRNLMFVTCQ